ncbi:MAG: Uma2 family endonuclease [Snowella sp.]|nr:Uma2 family endonuclease [Snowella sp.]
MLTTPINHLQLSPGSVVTLPDCSWTEFENLLHDWQNRRFPRVLFVEGSLTLMTPLPEHEITNDLLSDMVKMLLKVQGKGYQPFGSTTLKKEGLAGVEPDACFYITQYQQMIGRRRLLSDDPPPDLAIEIDVTSKTLLTAYRYLKVPEIWIYDQGKLTIYCLEGDDYRSVFYSQFFGPIPLTEVVPHYLERGWQVGNFQALQEWESYCLDWANAEP